ncbi:MAG: hypothetical protein LBH25_14870 [Fibromonadaceae bacterium]|jgi:hypothetical protein|nr:hypothetical protein [Fibromonadaceae bacterium]
MEYPETFIRGISSKSHILDGLATSEIFSFKDKPNRDDGFSETSINWCDDENALPFTMEQQKDDGSHRFQYGVAIIERIYADGLIKNPALKNIFKYERDNIPGNKYHGNLLYKHDGPQKNQFRKLIASTLASYAQVNPRVQQENQSDQTI